MAISRTYIPATPRSKVFKYYPSSAASGGGGGGGTTIIQPGNPGAVSGVAINKIGTGNTVVNMAENATDETVLDVTMTTRMASLATSGSGTVVRNLSYNAVNGVLTQNLTNPAGGGTYWGQVPVGGIVRGAMNFVDGIRPSIGGGSDIGAPAYNYRSAWVNVVNGDSVRLRLNSKFGNLETTFLEGRDRYVWHCYYRMYAGTEAQNVFEDRMANNDYNFYGHRIGCQTLTETSDISKKNIIKKIGKVDFSGISAYEYTYKDDEKERIKVGIIAQDVEKNFDHVVSGEEGDKGVNYNGLVALLINKVNELQERIEELELNL